MFSSSEMAFCDECGAEFVRESSKWCSECGTCRVEEQQDVVVVVAGTELQEIAHDSPISHLWFLPQYPNLTLYDRIYGQRIKGLPGSIPWGKSFLKKHHCYKKQYRKLKWNQQVVRNWFKPGKNEVVDEFFNIPSIRWNKEFKKKLHRYCRQMRSFADDDEKIVDINFSEEGTKISWRGSDILRYVCEIKHFRRSSKSSCRVQRLAADEPNRNVQAILPGPTSAVEDVQVIVPIPTSATRDESFPSHSIGEATSNTENVPQRLEPRRRRLLARLRDA